MSRSYFVGEQRRTETSESCQGKERRTKNDEETTSLRAPRRTCKSRETGSWECGAVMGHFRWSLYTPHMPSQSDCDHGVHGLLRCLSAKPQTDRLSHHFIKRSTCSQWVSRVWYRYKQRTCYLPPLFWDLNLLRHARRELFAPKLQYFFSFKYNSGKTNNKFITSQ